MSEKKETSLNTVGDAVTESTLFSDPEVPNQKKASAKNKRKKSLLKTQRRTIIIVVIIIAFILAVFFIGSAIRKRHIELGEAWNEFKAVMLDNMNDFQKDELDKSAGFAEWLAANRQSLSIVALVERDEAILALYDKSPRLKQLVDNIEKEVKFARYIDELVEDPEPTLKPIDGEVVGLSNQLYLYQPYERTDIQSIRVKNSHGEYGFVYDASEDDFIVEGFPNAPFDQNSFSSLVVTAGKPNMLDRVYDSCEDFTPYGLSDAQSPASFTVTTRSGDSQTVYIGDMIASGSGYYARHAERDALYVLGASLESTILEPLESLISPTLTLPMNESDYYMLEDFAVFKGSEMTVGITFLEESVKNKLGMDSPFYMFHPTAYSVHSTNYSTVTQKLNSFTGAKTLVYNPTEEDLDKYGLLTSTTASGSNDASDYSEAENLPAYAVSYVYNVQDEKLEQWVYFSQKNENGNYYAYTPQFDLIAEVSGEEAEWIEWELTMWVDDAIFMKNINEMATITVEKPGTSYVFDLTGTDQELKVTERNSGIKPEVQNFRQFYKVLLSTYLQGNIGDDLTEAEVEELRARTPDLTLSVETRSGKTTVYRFYQYATLRSYYTVDENDGTEPKGQFYVTSAAMNKIFSDAEKALNNEAVDSTARN